MPRHIKRAVVLLLAVALLLATVACNQTAYTSSANVVEAADLASLMQEPDAVVIDARSAEEFAKGHLQGAINLPPDKLSISEPVPGLLAPAEQVAATLGNTGISNASKVYVYDNNQGVYAGRVWWVLKVYGHDQVKVINGGEAAILKANLQLSQEAPALPAASYTAKALDESLYASKDEVKAVVDGSTQAVILDVRSTAEYEEGAIPTARLYPHTRNVYSDGTFKSARDIGLDYHDLGFKKDDAIILYCKTSFRATQTLLVLTEAGYSNVQVYDGAWVEWSQNEAPAEKPAQTVPSIQSAS